MFVVRITRNVPMNTTVVFGIGGCFGGSRVECKPFLLAKTTVNKQPLHPNLLIITIVAVKQNDTGLQISKVLGCVLKKLVHFCLVLHAYEADNFFTGVSGASCFQEAVLSRKISVPFRGVLGSVWIDAGSSDDRHKGVGMMDAFFHGGFVHVGHADVEPRVQVKEFGFVVNFVGQCNRITVASGVAEKWPVPVTRGVAWWLWLC